MLLHKLKDAAIAAWASIDSLNSVNFYFQWASAILVLLSFLLAAISITLTWRKDILQRAEDLRKEEAIASTHKMAAKLEADAASSRLEQEKFRKENLELQKTIEQERVARLEIEERIAPRRISSEQARLLESMVKPLAGQAIEIESASGFEVERFATELVAAFRRAGCVVVGALGTVTVGSSYPPGVTMRVGQDSIAKAELVAAALIASKIAPKPIAAVHSPKGLTITVGEKP